MTGSAGVAVSGGGGGCIGGRGGGAGGPPGISPTGGGNLGAFTPKFRKISNPASANIITPNIQTMMIRFRFRAFCLRSFVEAPGPGGLNSVGDMYAGPVKGGPTDRVGF